MIFQYYQSGITNDMSNVAECSDMKRFINTIISLVLVSVSFESFGQTITGKVLDENDAPLAYANVIMQTADSTFLSGTVTDTSGVFELDAEPEGIRIQVSFISYQTKYIEIEGSDIGIVRMVPDSEMLGKAVVRAVLPKTQIVGDAFVTNIENSVLADAGSANDVLKNLPGVIQKDGNFEVFGKGVPEIYINGRLVRDNSELEQLNSNEMTRVDVVQNPGARYDAAVKAVIRIKTVRRIGEGFGFDLRSSLMQSVNTDLVEAINMNYRYNSLDVFGSLNYNKSVSFQDMEVIQTLQAQNPLQLKQDGIYNGRSGILTPTLGFNYQFNENHSIGARYRPKIVLENSTTGDIRTEAMIAGKLDDNTNTLTDGSSDRNTTHQANMYYNGKIGNLNIDLNADMVSGGSNSQTIYDEQSELHEDRMVNTRSHTMNRLYASKVVFTFPLLGGVMTTGSEFIYTHRNDDYFNAENYVPDSKTTIREDNTNAFVEYMHPYLLGSLTIGLRYEHLGFICYESDVLQKDQSHKFDNFYPSASVSANAGDFKFQLSYATKTTRPSYSLMSNSVTYIDRYSITKGNPYLLPEINHDISLAAVWKYLQFSASYQIIQRAHVHVGAVQDGVENGMILYTRNFDRNIPRLQAMLSASPTISFWYPRFAIGVLKQWLSIDYLGDEKSMDAPIPFMSLTNTFVLPLGFRVSLDYNYTGKGCERVYELTRATHNLDISVRKSFLEDALCIELKGTDLLNRQAQTVRMFSNMYDIYQENIFDSRQVVLTVRYKFNSANSKYKGTGAGEQQKNRL